MYSYLRSKNLSAELYAFPCTSFLHMTAFPVLTHPHLPAVLTLCACTPPLDEVLQLWDFLLAFGVHLNVLCVIAQLLLMRESVMESSRYVLVSRVSCMHLRIPHQTSIADVTFFCSAFLRLWL